MLIEIDPFLPVVIVTKAEPHGERGPLDNFHGSMLAAKVKGGLDVLLASTERYEMIGHPDHWVQQSGDLTTLMRGRRVLCVGDDVALTLGNTVGVTDLPRFVQVRTRGLELVALPGFDGPYDGFSSQREGEQVIDIIAAEVDRYRKVRSSWCSIRLQPSGYGDSEQDIVYHPTTGTWAGDKAISDRSWCVDDAHAFDPRYIGLDAGQETALLDYLCTTAGRVARWGAGVPCYVGPHSMDVAGRTAQLARARDWDPGSIQCAVILAGLHDLHECLPFSGDDPGPVCRALRATSPAWRRMDDAARRAVLDLWAPGDTLRHAAVHSPSEIEALVLEADLDCRATERALFFGDAPARLGPRGVALAAAALRAKVGVFGHLPPESIYHYVPGQLYDAVRFGRPPAFCPSATLLPVDP